MSPISVRCSLDYIADEHRRRGNEQTVCRSRRLIGLFYSYPGIASIRLPSKTPPKAGNIAINNNTFATDLSTVKLISDGFPSARPDVLDPKRTSSPELTGLTRKGEGATGSIRLVVSLIRAAGGGSLNGRSEISRLISDRRWR